MINCSTPSSNGEELINPGLSSKLLFISTISPLTGANRSLAALTLSKLPKSSIYIEIERKLDVKVFAIDH